MAYHSSVLSQLLKSVPRLEFEQLANQQDGKRRSDALSRWSQFVALALGHLGSRHSLRDIEASLSTQSAQRYHLNIGHVSRSALARANEKLRADFYQQLFYSLYARCQQTRGIPGKTLSLQRQTVLTRWFADRSVDENIPVGRCRAEKSGFQITCRTRS